ncbi:elongator complex protein 4 isoform X2 [Selaginella moellendorffii]|uniref:elongator complex protein 4 isoform X2 n=1 Tax=Selaginella moellendorffii TaxID=88036 RepID=UPI000D1D028D|nr:elongator complex protein 4 isoform X2 [Selaginella moellendorffii]|eukprot:XP_024534080.1 elongator complex protein 4 isoform X2 [Selaginella moellendorffii]
MSFVRRRGVGAPPPPSPSPSPSPPPSPSSSSPSPSPPPPSRPAVTKAGPNATLLVSTGVADLDKLIGGGIGMGKLVVVMEDTHAPHHLVLLRYFMAQAVSHGQPLLLATALASPTHFLSTLPAPSASAGQFHNEAGLRIAWQYHKYDLGQSQQGQDGYVSSFDMRKSCTPGRVQCHSFSGAKVDSFLKQCRGFVSSLASSGEIGRIALHSICAPQCMEFCSEWELLSSLLYLKALLLNANAVALVTLPASLLAASSSKRWQHLADILLSVKALPGKTPAPYLDNLITHVALQRRSKRLWIARRWACCTFISCARTTPRCLPSPKLLPMPSRLSRNESLSWSSSNWPLWLAPKVPPQVQTFEGL